MANNIYIGNRYVPIFADPVEWDNLREYEALTIVTYNGTAYTSRKRVPVGTALNNTEYWVVTGNYNAQVEQYRQEVSHLNNSLTDEISNRVEADYMLNGGDLLCIGDSYLRGSTPTSQTIKSWGDYLADSMGKTINVDYFKYAQGGAGFVNTVEGNNFLSLLNTAHANITDPNKVGTIVVLGGRNDGISDNLLSAINTFMSNAHSLFPNAKVYYTYGSVFIADAPRTILYEIEQYERAVGGIYLGCVSKYLTAFKSLYYETGDHPNANGQRYIGEKIFNAINGAGLPSVSRANLILQTNEYYYNRIVNDEYSLGLHSMQAISLSFPDFNANGRTLAFTRDFTNDPNLYFNRPSSNYFTTTAPCVMQFGGANGKYYFGNVVIRLNGKTLEYYPLAVNDTNSTYMAGNLTTLIIHPFELKVGVNVI